MKSNTLRLFVSVLTICLLSGCGKTGVQPTETKHVEETVETSEIEVSTEKEIVEENKEVTTETKDVEVESETASEENDIDPNFNGAGHTGTLEETVQTYITYTELEPTTMYVISNNTGEQYSTYHDINVSEGELVVSGLVEPNQEIIIDGKGTFNNIEYYRIAFQEAMMLNHQIIIPVECLTSEKQQTQKPVEQQKPVETEKPVEQQQPNQQQPEVQQPSNNTTPEWTPDTGVSKEDWDSFFGGSNTTGQHTWTPDHDENFQSSVNENGGLTISGSGLDPSEVGGLTFH